MHAFSLVVEESVVAPRSWRITSARPRDVRSRPALRSTKPLRWSARQNSLTPRQSTHAATLSHKRPSEHSMVKLSCPRIAKQNNALLGPRCLGYRRGNIELRER
jgi:hypothetical protein